VASPDGSEITFAMTGPPPGADPEDAPEAGATSPRRRASANATGNWFEPQTTPTTETS